MHVALWRTIVVALALASLLTARPSLADNADASSEAALLLGTWDCSTSSSSGTREQVYSRRDATSLAVMSVVRTASGASGSVNETLKFDRASGVWFLDADKNQFFGAEHLKAPAWLAQDWTFSGTQDENGKSSLVRIVYVYAPPDSFVRQHQVRSGDRWSVDGESICRRAPLETRYDRGFPPPTELAAGDADTESPSAAASPQNPSPSPLASASQHAPPSPNAGLAHASAVKRPVTSKSPDPSRVALGITAPKPRSNVTDRAYDLVRGVWECKTFGGAEATHTYTRENDDSIVLHNTLKIGTREYDIDELYRFDRAKKAWTTITSGDAYAGVAGRWLTDKWVFVGDMPIGNHRVPVEMIYSMLGNRQFRREFIRVQNGKRATFAAETCQQR